MTISRVGIIAIIAFVSPLGCGAGDSLDPSGEQPLDEVEIRLQAGDAFVPVARDVGAEILAARKRALGVSKKTQALSARAPEDFYLAIHKSQLGAHWFLSAMLDNVIVDDFVFGGYSLGTRVISFERQNDRMYVFDVDQRKKVSDLFDPDVLLEAYPVVEHRHFRRLRGSRDYVLIDPSAGLNRFDLFSDTFSSAAERITVDISFLQNYRDIADGITYDQVFSGYSNRSQAPGGSSGTPLEPNGYRVAGTMSVAIRRYAEGPGFTPTPLPPFEHYFRSDTRAVSNTGQLEQTALHWNVHPGMEPIDWVISHDLAAFDARPEYQDVDLVGAITAGIEGWNQAFGFEVFVARLAEPGEDIITDDKNFFLFDPDISAGAAFAQWRSNPNTGEIRGASAYMPAAFMRLEQFVDDPAAGQDGGGAAALEPGAAPPPALPSRSLPALAWGPLGSRPHCLMPAGHGAALAPGRDSAASQDSDFPLTAGQKLERYVTQVAAHEIGHTLGLRHNFMGSVESPSTSVMDYLPGDDSRYRYTPGSYDVVAVRYSHGLDPSWPEHSFCTDENLAIDPACVTFDPAGSNPLDNGVRDYELVLPFLFSSGLDGLEIYLDYYSRILRSLVVSGHYQAQQAYEELLSPVRPPLDPDLIADDPFYAEVADDINRRLFTLLLVEPSVYDRIRGPIVDPVMRDLLTQDLAANLANLDGIRSFETRRLAVDLLEGMQTVQAYSALLQAGDEIARELEDGTLDHEQRLLTLDLQARIEAACDPYFD